MTTQIEDGVGNGDELPADRGRLLLQGDTDGARLAEVFRQAPAFMCVLRGPDHVFEMANERYFQLIGHRDIIGKQIRDALPEVEGQGYFELIDQVDRTGDSFSRTGVPVFLAGLPGQPLVERHVDFVTQPLTVRDARWQIRRADGSVIIAQGSAQPLRGPQGEKIGAVLTVREAPSG